MLTRPEKVYLDAPIFIDEIKITHTLLGLQYLVEHFTHCLSIATPKQMSDEDRKHSQKIIENYQQHIALYEKQKQQKTQTT